MEFKWILSVIILLLPELKAQTSDFHCPDPSWFLWNDSCYFVDANAQLSWHEAETVCSRHNSHLTSILSSEEDQFIWSKIPDSRNHLLWIGLKKVSGYYASYTWSDDETISYMNWDELREDLSGSSAYIEKCAGIHKDTKNDGWSKYSCLSPGGVICKGSAVTRTRLLGGQDTNEGLLQAMVNSTWVTVCASLWNQENANVACRQLGYSASTNDIRVTRTDPAEGSTLWYSHFNCSGGERDIFTCSSPPTTDNDTDATEVCYSVNVRCFNDTVSYVRLIDGRSANEGRVELFVDGNWGTIGDNFWGPLDADVVCRQLGFGTAVKALHGSFFGQGTGPVLIQRVNCTGHENSILQCMFSTDVDQYNHDRDAGVICGNTSYARTIRLARGKENDFEGRVEMYRNGKWGTVCGTMWNMAAANVACKQLRMGKAIYAFNDAREFGQGSGPILINYISCRGNENSLDQCDQISAVATYCSHHWDAGVRCLPLADTESQCPGTNWRAFNGYCYYVTNSAGQWHEMQALCRGYGSNLASITSSKETELLLKMTKGENRRNMEVVWIGLRKDSTHGQFYWIDGKPLLYTNWNRGEPYYHYRGKAEDCVTVFTAQSTEAMGRWNDVWCEDTRTYGSYIKHGFCKKPLETNVRLVGGNENEGNVEVKLSGEWINVCDESWDIDDAKVICRQLGFQNATDAVSGSLFEHGTANTWITGLGCTGTEQSWDLCNHNNVSESECTHLKDAGVRCGDPVDTILMRLVNGTNEKEGNVEIFLNGEWGTVCDDGWTLHDANVVCHYLGFGDATEAAGSSKFGEGSGPIWFDDVKCTGHEESLDQCHHTSGDLHNCDHSEDAGVVCGNITVSKTVRLLGGVNGDFEGRVEVFVNGDWGTICEDRWGLEAANIVCYQLGYSGALEATAGGIFGRGIGPIWYRNVECKGDEETIQDCSKMNNDFTCDHSGDAGVRCRVLQDSLCPSVDWYPYNGFCYYIGSVRKTWGAARDYCQQYGGDLASITSSEENTFIIDLVSEKNFARDAWIGLAGKPETGLEWCDGTPDIDFERFKYTRPTIFRYQECFFIEIADSYNHGRGTWNKVRCSDFYGFVCKKKLNANIRLVNGTSHADGYVEVFVNNEWGRICDSSWNNKSAKVVCQELGYTSGVTTNLTAIAAEAHQSWYTDVNCTGEEKTLRDCNITIANESIPCAHDNEASVLCGDLISITPSAFKIRLVDGATPLEGRLEVFFQNEWGTVCDDFWNVNGAMVACRELGFTGVEDEDISITKGEGPIFLDNVKCTGIETSLEACDHMGVGLHNCVHYNDVGIKCSNASVPDDSVVDGNQFDIRLVGGSNKAEGRVEVFVGNSWGTVCDDDWDLTDAKVVCHQLGYHRATAAYSYARFGYGAGDIKVTYLQCNGHETLLSQCTHLKIDGYYRSCSHREDASVRCEDATVQRLRFSETTVGFGSIEAFVDGEWNVVCAEGLTKDLTDAICKRQGYGESEEIVSQPISEEGSGFIEQRIWNITANCEEGDTMIALSRCSIKAKTVSTCYQPGYGFVKCSNSSASFGIRLADGGDKFRGRVEVYLHGEWGTVCDDLWNLHAANVVCRELGFGEALDSHYRIHPGIGPIFYDDVVCDGTENSIENCQNKGIGVHNCGHEEDIGIICSSAIVDICPLNWTKHDGYCIYASGLSRLYSWGQAQSFCKSFGGNLASSTSTEKNSYFEAKILNTTSDHASGGVWIGFRKYQLYGDFSWVDGSDTNYIHWKEGEPTFEHNGNREDCVNILSAISIYSTNLFGFWNDVPCSAKRPFLCELEINECLSNPCENEGICTNLVNEYECSCPKEWTGVNCDQDVNECEINPCMNNGKCINKKGSFMCECGQRWTGDTCSAVMDCSMVTCMNNGECSMKDNMPQCECSGGWTGKLCNTSARASEKPGLAVGLTLLTIALIAIAIAAFCFLYVRRKSAGQNDSHDTNEMLIIPS